MGLFNRQPRSQQSTECFFAADYEHMTREEVFQRAQEAGVDVERSADGETLHWTGEPDKLMHPVEVMGFVWDKEHDPQITLWDRIKGVFQQ